MATQTREELSQDALVELQVTPAGISAAAEDAEEARKQFDNVYALMEGDGLAPFPTTAIPEEAQHALREMVKIRSAPFFGRGAEYREKDFQNAKKELRQALKRTQTTRGIKYPRA